MTNLAAAGPFFALIIFAVVVTVAMIKLSALGDRETDAPCSKS